MGEYSQLSPAIRLRIVERDGIQCRRCGMPQSELRRALEVHHLKPVKEHETAADAHGSTNLVSLCDSCHAEMEKKTVGQQLNEIGVENISELKIDLSVHRGERDLRPIDHWILDALTEKHCVTPVYCRE